MNDSAIITKHLIRAKGGKNAFDEQWERTIAYVVQPSVVLQVVASRSSCIAWATGSGGLGLPYAATWLAAGTINRLITKSYTSNPLNTVQDPKIELRRFMEGVGKKPFFGGDTPSPVDLSLYGSLAVFIVQRAPSMLALLDACEMWPWVLRMDACVPLREINPKAKPFDLKELADSRGK